MLVSDEYLIFRDLFDLRVDAVEIDGVVKLIFKEIILDRHLAAAVYEMARVLTRRPAVFALGSNLAPAYSNGRALLRDERHTPAGVDCDIFESHVLALGGKECLTDAAGNAENDHVANHGRNGNIRNTEHFTFKFQIKGIEKRLAEVIVAEPAADLFGSRIVFEGSCEGHFFVLYILKKSVAVTVELGVLLAEVNLYHLGARFNDLALEIADIGTLDCEIFDGDVLRIVDYGKVHTTVKIEDRSISINGQAVEILDDECRALVAVVTVIRHTKDGVRAVFFINVLFSVRDLYIVVARSACRFKGQRK